MRGKKRMPKENISQCDANYIDKNAKEYAKLLEIPEEELVHDSYHYIDCNGHSRYNIPGELMQRILCVFYAMRMAQERLTYGKDGMSIDEAYAIIDCFGQSMMSITYPTMIQLVKLPVMWEDKKKQPY